MAVVMVKTTSWMIIGTTTRVLIENQCWKNTDKNSMVMPAAWKLNVK